MKKTDDLFKDYLVALGHKNFCLDYLKYETDDEVRKEFQKDIDECWDIIQEYETQKRKQLYSDLDSGAKINYYSIGIGVKPLPKKYIPELREMVEKIKNAKQDNCFKFENWQVRCVFDHYNFKIKQFDVPYGEHYLVCDWIQDEMNKVTLQVN